jgi:myo-inositol catabolism protein IolC
VFLDAIKKYMSGEFTNDEAIKEIGENYFKLYQAFINAKTHE